MSQDFNSLSEEAERDLRFRLRGKIGPRPIAKYFFIAAFFLLLMVAATSIGIYMDSERAEFEASVDRQVERGKHLATAKERLQNERFPGLDVYPSADKE